MKPPRHDGLLHHQRQTCVGNPRGLVCPKTLNPSSVVAQSRVVWIRDVCCGLPVIGIIDTRSSVTVVSPAYAKRLGNIVSPWIGPPVKMANDNLAQPTAANEIEVTMDQKTVPVSALVMSVNSYYLLIGNNVL